MTPEAVASSFNPLAPLSGEDRLAVEMRAYARESSVVAATLCLMGCIALMILFLGRFRVEIDSRGGRTPVLQVVNEGGRSRIAPTQQPVDMTSALALFSAATLAAATVIFGGTLFHLRRMPAALGATLGVTALFSISGLVLLFVNLI